MGHRQGTAVDRLVDHLRGSSALWECLERLAGLRLPWWQLGAGCVAQTVWNAAHDKPPAADISDYVVVYFDSGDLTEGGENAVATRVRTVMSDLAIAVDVKNQARVHLWYQERFGYEIVPYTSIEDAIATWPTTATAIGVRLVHGRPQVFAPCGLGDLLGLVVRANRVQITPEIYRRKVARWHRHWPNLTVLPWDAGRGEVGRRRIVRHSRARARLSGPVPESPEHGHAGVDTRGG